MLVKEIIEKYLGELDKDNDTLKAYRLDLEKFLVPFGEREITHLSKDNIKDYLDSLMTRNGKRVSVSTQNRHYATLSRLYNWAIEESMLAENPMKSIKRRRPNKDKGEVNTKEIVRALEPDTVQEIIDRAPSVREEFLFDLLYSSGIRISEALDLNIQDIRNGVISIRQGKGNKARVSYLSKHTEKLLKKYLEKRVADKEVMSRAQSPEEREQLKDTGALFTTNSGNRLGYHRANQLFKQAAGKLSNPDGTKLTLHQLRHTFCTERAGYMDSMVLQRLAGHSDIRTTLRYAKVSDKLAKEKFHEFDNSRVHETTQLELAATNFSQ